MNLSRLMAGDSAMMLSAKAAMKLRIITPPSNSSCDENV